MKKLILALLLLGSSLAYGKQGTHCYCFNAIDNLSTSAVIVTGGYICLSGDYVTIHYNKYDDCDTYKVSSVERLPEQTVYHARCMITGQYCKIIKSKSRIRLISQTLNFSFRLIV